MFGFKKTQQPQPQRQPSPEPSQPVFVHNNYASNDIAIPDTFLTGPPSKPITAHPVNFIPQLPEYKDCTALVLENVLSPDECQELLRLAEASVPITTPKDSGADSKASSPWQPALVNVGVGMEVAVPGYRESDRIIWDQQVVVDRLWARCALSAGLREQLATCPGHTYQGRGQWAFSRMNNRMRFLKYRAGQYFQSHCDGPYYYTDADAAFETFYTVHLYLNDSSAVDPASDLVGGATSFLSRDEDRRIDVNPKAGSVLIFQHDRLLHEGATVTAGVKYTMRTDILYQWAPLQATVKRK